MSSENGFVNRESEVESIDVSARVADTGVGVAEVLDDSPLFDEEPTLWHILNRAETRRRCGQPKQNRGVAPFAYGVLAIETTCITCIESAAAEYGVDPMRIIHDGRGMYRVSE